MSSRLGLGTAQFGLAYGIANQRGQVSRTDAAAILNEARARGLDTLDTAIAYGQSEDCLGAAGVADWHIVSKLPALPESCPDIAAWVSTHIKSSLNRLGVEQLQGLLLHRPLQLVGPHGEALAAAMREARAHGWVRKIGVSVYAPDELDRVYRMLKPDLVQAPLNLVDRRLVDSGWLQRLGEDGVEVHTRSSFLQGLLLMPQVPTRFARWEPLWSRWKTWLADSQYRAINACIAYPLSFHQVTRVTVGVDSLAQLLELCEAENELPPVDKLPDLSSSDESLVNPAKWSSDVDSK